jgi:hypothetical protein
LGYSLLHKGVKCLDVNSGRIYISRDVVFDEQVFPFASLHPNAGAQLRKEILLFDSLLSSNEGVYNHDNVPIVPVTDPSQVVPHLHDPISLHNQQIEHEISSFDEANSSTEEPIVDTEQQVDSAADSSSDTISADTARSDPELLLSRQAAKSGDNTSVHVTAPDRTQTRVTANMPESTPARMPDYNSPHARDSLQSSGHHDDSFNTTRHGYREVRATQHRRHGCLVDRNRHHASVGKAHPKQGG